MDSIKNKLEAYGADVRGITERFMGDAELYKTCLEIFFGDENFELLGKALEAGDAVAGFEAAHALKGVSANLGLLPLYHAVCAVVEPLRRGETEGLSELYAEITAQRERVRELL